MELDELARAARDDLHRSVGALVVPAAVTPRRRRGALVVAVAAIVAVAVGGAALLGRDDAPRRVVAGAATDRYFLPKYLPDAMSPFAVLPNVESPAVVMRAAYFGESGQDDPFARRDALVLTVGADSEVTLSNRGDAVDVRGTTGHYLRDDAQAGFSVNLVQVVADGVQMVVASRHLDRDELVAFANDLTIRDANIRASGPVQGLALISSVDAAPVGLNVLTAVSRTVIYRSDGQLLTVSIGRGDANALRVLRWWSGDPTTINGHPAMRVAYPQMGSAPVVGGLSYVWQLDDGTVLTVQGLLDEAELRRVAESLEEVSAAEWDALQEASRAGAPEPPVGSAASPGIVIDDRAPNAGLPPVVSSVSGQDGEVTWTYEDRGTRQCLELASSVGGTSSSCGPTLTPGGPTGPNSAGPLGGTVSLPVNGRVYFIVPVGEDVTALRIDLADGRTAELRLIASSTDGRALFIGSAVSVQGSSGSPPQPGANLFVSATLTHRDGTTSTRQVFLPELAIAAPQSAPATTR
jgi:hypothetical protein